MKSNDYLNAVQAKLGINSDYALAKHVGLTRSAISKIRTNKANIGIETSYRIAQVLGIHPAIVMADSSAERTQDEEVLSVWAEIAARFSDAESSKTHSRKPAREAQPA